MLISFHHEYCISSLVSLTGIRPHKYKTAHTIPLHTPPGLRLIVRRLTCLTPAASFRAPYAKNCSVMIMPTKKQNTAEPTGHSLNATEAMYIMTHTDATIMHRSGTCAESAKQT